MITIVGEEPVQYPAISDAVLEHHRGQTFAWLDRPIAWDEEALVDAEGEVVTEVDDRMLRADGSPAVGRPVLRPRRMVGEITRAEIEEGYSRIRAWLFQRDADPLLAKARHPGLDDAERTRREAAWREVYDGIRDAWRA